MPFQIYKYQKIPLFLLMVAVAVLLGICISFVDVRVYLYLTILLIAFLLSVSLSVLFNHPKRIIHIIFFALTLRVTIFILLKLYSYHVGLDGFFPGDVDAYAYHNDALKAINSHSWLQALEGNLSYTYFVAFLYNLFGPDMNIPQLINLSASVLAIPLIYELGDRVGGRKVGITAIWLWSIFPSAIFWSISLLKDAFVTLGMVLSIFLILAISKTKLNGKDVFLGVCGILLISSMRPQFLLAISITILLVILFQFFKGNKNFLRNTIFILLAVGIIGSTSAGTIIMESFDKSTSAEGVQTISEIALDGNSGIPLVTMFPSEIRWLVQLPFSIFAPFPWQWLSVSQGIYMLSGLEMIACYIMYYLIWKNRADIFKNQTGVIILLYAFFIFIAVSFSLPNIGSIYRYRFAALTVLLPLVFYKPFCAQKKERRLDE